MAPSSLIFLSFFLLLSSATAFNITKLLNTFPSFSTYNDYLTQTQLNAEINSRQTITVLVVDNSAISSLSGKPIEVIKKIMSLHVILDYYDVAKLQGLSKKTALLTTLFQSSGLAMGQQGFVNVTDLTTGDVAFGSAVKGSSLDAKLVKLVAAQPYNISVLQISSVIFYPNGTENSNNNNTNATSPPPSSVAPVASPKKSPSTPPSVSPTKAPTPKPSKAPAPSADAPSDDADAPSKADAPSVGDAPLSSPPMPDTADGPASGPADDTGATAPTDSPPSSATRISLGTFVSVVMVVVSAWVAL